MNWSQLKTVLWLRWRLSANQFRRRGGFNAAITILGIIMGLWICVATWAVGFFGGWLELSKVEPRYMLIAWDAIIGIFLFIWLLGLLAEIQRSETIDLTRLLHLPISLHSVFFINYLVSLLTMSMIILFPAMMGLCLGLILGRGFMMIFMLPLVLSFVFMVTAWAYCLRGWLLALMVNPRKRRNVIVAITLAVVLLGQAPNLYFNVYLRFQNKNQGSAASHSAHPMPNSIPAGWLTAHGYAPVLWVPNGAMALAEGRVMPAVLGSFGALLIGALGLSRAYRSTMRFYTGQEKAKAVTAKPAATATPSGAPVTVPRTFLEKQVPFVSEEVAALALALFRSLSRAPEIRIALFTNFLVIIVLIAIVFSKTLKTIPPAFQLFCATGAVAFTFFGLIQTMFNQFGLDRDGFRALVLSPTKRRDVLFAKNLSFAPFAIGLGGTLVLLLLFLLRLPVLVVAGALCQLVAMFLFISMAGNFVSIFVPYRISAGSLKPTKPPAKVILLAMVTQILFPVAMVPIVLPPLLGFLSEKFGFLPASLVDAALSLGLLGVTVLFYRLSLEGLGRMLERREQKILLVVSQEVE